jgi:5-methylcytosine-specific restriction endonuclease McrA
MDRARYTTQLGRAAHSARPGRESLSKRLGKVARQIRERDAHRCAYCGATAETSGAHLHLDHLTPKNQGGKNMATNLVLACRHYNSTRQNMTLTQWAAYAAVKLGLDFSPRAVRGQARRRLPE